MTAEETTAHNHKVLRQRLENIRAEIITALKNATDAHQTSYSISVIRALRWNIQDALYQQDRIRQEVEHEAQHLCIKCKSERIWQSAHSKGGHAWFCNHCTTAWTTNKTNTHHYGQTDNAPLPTKSAQP